VAAAVVRFRPTNPLEIPWIRTLEGHPDVQPFIVCWSAAEHEQAIADPTRAHWVVEEVGSGRAVGFVILSGVDTESVELIRVVISRRDEGLGRATIQLLKTLVFEDWGAKRLSLDVCPFNERARHLYESMGFVAIDPEPAGDAHPNGTRRAALIVLESLPA